MDNTEELRREADEVKDKLKRNIQEFREILQRASLNISQTKQQEVEEAVKKAEQHINETVTHVEEKFEKAIGLMAGSIQANEDVVTRRLDYRDFNNIEAGCAFRIETVQSEKFDIAVSAVKDLIDDVIILKSGNTLKMSLRQHIFQSRPRVEVKVGMPLLNKIRLGAATRCTMKGFKSTENLDIRLTGNSVLDADIIAGNARCEISGASRLTGKMQLDNAEFILSGASRVELQGSAKNVTLNSWGASHAQTEDFQVDNMTVQMNGGSEAVINVSETIDINLDSGSRLTYLNSPNIHSISVSGASSLSHK
ncbi:MAG: DUF2807 domain-containing protein [Dehalococcoidales bacterium]|nr:DUF2807 domain-containing protein [Dehalococcoidales bacterium]